MFPRARTLALAGCAAAALLTATTAQQHRRPAGAGVLPASLPGPGAWRWTMHCDARPASTGVVPPTAGSLAGAAAPATPAAGSHESRSPLGAWIERSTGLYENRLRALSHPRKVFQYFASVTQVERGSGTGLASVDYSPGFGGRVVYMTPADLMVSLLPYQPAVEEAGLSSINTSVVRQRLQEFLASTATGPGSHPIDAMARDVLALADLDGDGLVSFSEYLCFVAAVSAPLAWLREAFHSSDANSNGLLDREELAALIRYCAVKASIGAAQGQAEQSSFLRGSTTSRLVTFLLGESDNQAGVSLERFEEALLHLRHAVLRLEFICYREPGDMADDCISATALARALAAYSQDAHKFRSVRRLARLSQHPDLLNARISFDEFVRLDQVVRNLDDVIRCLQIRFASEDGLFTKEDFSAAIKICFGFSLGQATVTALFGALDSDESNSLDVEELERGLRSRASYGFTRSSTSANGPKTGISQVLDVLFRK
ncbi:hypothetical protein H696_05709 [Fonticula alba]|uniref:EF-hand domain-containing protein n=1 Tax=Fonticula alba TaxID=691883 RepID=A0A058Z0V0_FONAL|nr:hypothetical protein H696_05709 [Fonticula alba]KCV67766.1 hypothetical protein H696_05709 [Fonticula alba]|eukprot:XP_009497797.1 hypothetical protein H696_05709 [Fonticula alba]